MLYDLLNIWTEIKGSASLWCIRKWCLLPTIRKKTRYPRCKITQKKKQKQQQKQSVTFQRRKTGFSNVYGLPIINYLCQVHYHIYVNAVLSKENMKIRLTWHHTNWKRARFPFSLFFLYVLFCSVLWVLLGREGGVWSLLFGNFCFRDGYTAVGRLAVRCWFTVRWWLFLQNSTNILTGCLPYL